MKFKKVLLFFKITIYILIILLIINFITNYFSERVKTYIKQKATLISSQLIAKTIEEEVVPNIDIEGLFKMVNNNEKIESIYINTYQVNNILGKTTKSLGDALKNIDDEQLNNLKLPIGIIFSDVFFNNIGPNINIKIYPVGSVEVDIKSTIKEYGINNSIFRLDIEVKVNFAVVVPLQTDEITVITNIPLIVQIIQGEVPRYYYSNSNGQFIPMPID